MTKLEQAVAELETAHLTCTVAKASRRLAEAKLQKLLAAPRISYCRLRKVKRNKDVIETPYLMWWMPVELDGKQIGTLFRYKDRTPEWEADWHLQQFICGQNFNDSPWLKGTLDQCKEVIESAVTVYLDHKEKPA